MEQGNSKQGWHADPLGLHEMRYFSAGQPTKLVRDGHTESYDDPPVPAQLRPAAATQPEPQPASAPAAATPDAATQPDSPSAGAAAAAAAPAAATEAQPDPQPEPAAAAVAAGAGGELDEPGGSQPSRNLAGLGPLIVYRRSGRLYAAVAVAAVAIIVAVIGLTGGFTSPPASVSAWNGTAPAAAAAAPGSHAETTALGMAPAAFVTRSAQHTLASKTADVTVAGSTAVDGHMLVVHGTGQVDFADGSAAIAITGSGQSGTIGETEILTPSAFYLSLSAKGKTLTWANGHKHWMEVPVTQSGAQTVTAAGPVSPLRLLGQQGGLVRALGTKTIGGQACSGFSVTPTRQTVIAVAQQQWKHLRLTTAEKAAAMRTLQQADPPAITVWLNPRSQLACEANVQMQSSSPGSTAATGMELVMTFTRYGVPVHITQPATDDSVLF